MKRIVLLVTTAALIAGCASDDEAAPAGGDATSTRTTTAQGGLDTPPSDPPTTAPWDEPPSGHPAVGHPLKRPKAKESFAELQDALGGQLGIAATPLGRGEPILLGELSSGVAWSTMKVPIVVALIRELGGLGGLSESERAAAEAAITASDNEAAQMLFDRLADLGGGVEGANDAIEEVLRESGDESTEINSAPSPEGYSTFGQTDWSAVDATRFFDSLASACLLELEDRTFVVDLLSEIVPDQRWGLGDAGFPATETLFKGGWGPGRDGTYLVRQSGSVADEEGHGGWTVTILAEADPASGDTFAAGTEMVTAAARWLADLGPMPAITVRDCGPPSY